MNTPRARFNARARQSSAGESSHKKRKRVVPPLDPKNVNHDPNVEIIKPKTKEDKELDRRERLKQEVPGLKDICTYQCLFSLFS
jgi:ATP-dependent RNA helicase DHX37/DHR1